MPPTTASALPPDFGDEVHSTTLDVARVDGAGGVGSTLEQALGAVGHPRPPRDGELLVALCGAEPGDCRSLHPFVAVPVEWANTYVEHQCGAGQPLERASPAERAAWAQRVVRFAGVCRAGATPDRVTLAVGGRVALDAASLTAQLDRRTPVGPMAGWTQAYPMGTHPASPLPTGSTLVLETVLGDTGVPHLGFAVDMPYAGLPPTGTMWTEPSVPGITVAASHHVGVLVPGAHANTVHLYVS